MPQRTKWVLDFYTISANALPGTFPSSTSPGKHFYTILSVWRIGAGVRVAANLVFRRRYGCHGCHRLINCQPSRKCTQGVLFSNLFSCSFQITALDIKIIFNFRGAFGVGGLGGLGGLEFFGFAEVLEVLAVILKGLGGLGGYS